MLGGFVLLAQITGTYQIDQILMMTEQIQSHHLFVPTLLLILLGAFTKSAQFPVLTSGYPMQWLHPRLFLPIYIRQRWSKQGIFLLARLLPIFAGAALYHNLVTFIGLFTLCMAAILRHFQRRFKRLIGVFHHQSFRSDHVLTRHWFTVSSSCCNFPHHQPRHL